MSFELLTLRASTSATLPSAEDARPVIGDRVAGFLRRRIGIDELLAPPTNFARLSLKRRGPKWNIIYEATNVLVFEPGHIVGRTDCSTSVFPVVVKRIRVPMHSANSTAGKRLRSDEPPPPPLSLFSSVPASASASASTSDPAALMSVRIPRRLLAEVLLGIIMSTLETPHAPLIYDAFHCNDYLYIISERCGWPALPHEMPAPLLRPELQQPWSQKSGISSTLEDIPNWLARCKNPAERTAAGVQIIDETLLAITSVLAMGQARFRITHHDVLGRNILMTPLEMSSQAVHRRWIYRLGPSRYISPPSGAPRMVARLVDFEYGCIRNYEGLEIISADQAAGYSRSVGWHPREKESEKFFDMHMLLSSLARLAVYCNVFEQTLLPRLFEELGVRSEKLGGRPTRPADIIAVDPNRVLACKFWDRWQFDPLDMDDGHDLVIDAVS